MPGGRLHGDAANGRDQRQAKISTKSEKDNTTALNLARNHTTFLQHPVLSSTNTSVTRSIVLGSFALLFAVSANAQPGPIAFQHISVDDGLSQDIVTSITQDELGFMWFGTENGLNLYDGYSCTVFKHLSGDTTTISGNSIGPMMPDGRGRLWVSASGGTDIIDVRTRAIRHVYIPGTGRRLHTLAFCMTPDSSIWLSTDEGLFRTSGDALLPAHLFGSTPSDVPWSLSAEAPDILWTISSHAVHRYRVKGDTLRARDLPESLRVLQNRLLSTVFRDSRGWYWVLTGDAGIYRFDESWRLAGHYHTHANEPDRIPENGMRTVTEGPSGSVWFGTMSGLEVFDPATSRFSHFRGTPNTSSGFIGSRTYSLYRDRSGILWIGTYRGGINTYAPIRQKFRLYSLTGVTEANDAYAVLPANDGSLLVGTDRGLYAIRTASPSQKWSILPGTAGKNVFSICKRRNGEIWAGMEGSIALVQGHTAGPQVIPIRGGGPVPVVFEDNRENLLIGTTFRGLSVLKKGSSNAEHWPSDTELASGSVWMLFQDGRDHLWIGTGDGMWFYEPESGPLRRRGSVPGDTGFVPGAPVKVVREDTSGGLWFGMWGNGIAYMNPVTHAVRRYTELNGLASNFVKSMEIDRHGSLWIGTERGLNAFDPDRETFRTFTRHDGLPSDFFFSGSSTRLADGSLCFGCAGGCIVFNPDSLRHNDIPPPVVVTMFRLFDRPLPLESHGTAEPAVTLRYDQNFFSFEFVSLDYTDPGRNQYAYRLEGFDTAWVKAGTRRYAAYTHLDPGFYRFHVTASNSDGIWNEQGATVAVTITPAFWMTWWFRLAILAGVLISAAALYRYRVRSILHVERLRQRIARDLHDDIGTNLSAIVLASDLGPSAPPSPEARTALDEIRAVALVTQEHMRDIVWMLNPQNDSPELLVARMREDATRLLRTIPHTFQGPSGELPREISLALKRNIFLMYKESLHNISRHSRATTAAIDIEYINGKFDISVQDDGVGFDPRSVIRGNGLDSMEERAGQIGAELNVDSVPGMGTRVRIRAKIT